MSDKQRDVHVSMGDANTRLELHLRKLFEHYGIDRIAPISDEDFDRLAARHAKQPNVFTFAKALQESILPALYVWETALRNDWGELMITRKAVGIPRTGNWLQVRPDGNSPVPMMIMHLRDYKTSKIYGPQRIELKPKIRSLLNIWLQLLTRLTGKSTNMYMLYYTINGKGVVKHNESKNTIAQALRRASDKIFGKTASINVFRHSQIMAEHAEDKRAGFQEPTVREKTARANKHLHSFKTNAMYNLKRDG